jgi:hypothetical protein
MQLFKTLKMTGAARINHNYFDESLCLWTRTVEEHAEQGGISGSQRNFGKPLWTTLGTFMSSESSKLEPQKLLSKETIPSYSPISHKNSDESWTKNV